LWIQKSFQSSKEEGQLLLVPTPIGNLEDMTFRAIRELKEADIIAAEDTRQTKKLCNYFEISTPLISYHEHNKNEVGKKIIADIKSGKRVALVSDAGMPCISDPGEELVFQCVEQEITVIPIPGANAALTALIASGLNTDHFYFFGFLQRGKKDKKKQLEQLKTRKETLIFYESPHRLKETLKLMGEAFGNRKIVLSRELTKKFEEFSRGTIEEMITLTNEVDPRGEYCLIVDGTNEEVLVNPEELWWNELSIADHIDQYIDKEDISTKEAIKKVAVDRGVPKREIYNSYHT
jgi:16S rRNA (cytidine1402-2'-O)-methyltransferase